MPYTERIKRAQPGCMVFLIDQSLSMSDRYGVDPAIPSKAAALADVLNRLLHNVVMRCTQDTGECYDYFDVAVIGYTTDDQGNSIVRSALGGDLAGDELVPISKINEYPLRVDEREKQVDEGAGRLVTTTEKLPVWVEPVAEYGTPMCAALSHVHGLVQRWVGQHQDSFPPIIFHITDGESTDGDPGDAGRQLLSLGTTDGNVLLFNIHISESEDAPVFLPASKDELAMIRDNARVFAEQLFDISSEMPDSMRALAASDGQDLAPGARGFAFNTNLIALFRFLDVGTKVAPSLK